MEDKEEDQIIESIVIALNDDILEQDINDSFNSLNVGLVSKKEIIGILLVDCFYPHFYARPNNIRKEVTEFLTQSFTFLSLPHTLLNYLIVNNNNNNNNKSNNTSLTITGNNSPLIKGLTSSSSQPSLPLLNGNKDQSPDSEGKEFIKEYIPKKLNREILNDLEHILDYSFHQEMEVFQSGLSKSTSITEKSQCYTSFYSKLMSQSTSIFPSKYSHLVTSNTYFETLNQCLEFYIIQNIFHNIYPIDFEKDRVFSTRIQTLSFIEPCHLGIKIEDSSLINAKKCINRINSYQTPIEKKRCIAKMMVYLMQDGGGEDYLLPMVIYLLLRTNPPNLWSNYRYLELYSIPTGNINLDSIYDNFFTTFSVAIQFIDKLDHTHLSIDYDYFQQKMSSNSNNNNNNNVNNNNSSNSNNLNESNNNFNEIIKIEGGDLDQIENIKLFKQLNRLQGIIDILKLQLDGNEMEELMLKFITVSLASDFYHSTIRFPLRRFFIEYLGIGENMFCVTEMEIIGSLKDNTQSSTDLLPNRSLSDNKKLKVAKIAGAALTGAVVVGLTGGLAAPFVGSVLSALGAGSLMTGLATTTGVSSATMLSVVFGAAGAKVSADRMISATSDVQDYSIHKVKSQTSLHAILYIDGFTSVQKSTDQNNKSNQNGQVNKVESWERIIRSVTNDYGDIFLIDYEKEVKAKLQSIIMEYQSTIVQTLFRSAATNIISTSLAHALVPLSIIKAASVLDNPWTLLKDRSEKAGRMLAHQILDGSFGKRPLTLVGTGMGSRVIFYCLEELEKESRNPTRQTGKQEKDITEQDTPISPSSIIEMVVFIGSPIPSDIKRWTKIISMVSGRVVNCYSTTDLILKYVCRSANCLSDGVLPPSGATPIHIPSSSVVVENVDVSNVVKSHLDYEKEWVITKILEHIGINKVSYCEPRVAPRFSGIVYDL